MNEPEHLAVQSHATLDVTGGLIFEPPTEALHALRVSFSRGRTYE